MSLKFASSLFCSLLGCVLLTGFQPLRAQEIVAEPNLALFTVMAAVQATGHDAVASPAGGNPLAEAFRKELASREIPSLPALKDFCQTHRLADPARNLSQYVSLALFLSEPPSFELRVSPVNLPSEVLDLQEMVPLVAAFYQEAGIEELWAQYLPEMESESERYRKLLARVIQQTNGYLRLDLSGYPHRRFAVYVNPLGAPNRTDVRIYADDYFVVVGPSAELPEEEIQHAWLHLVLDDYPFRHRNLVESKAALREITRRVPSMDTAFRDSFGLLLTESLIRAILARRSQAAPEARSRAVTEAVEEGFFLTAYFFGALEEFEQQPVGMKLYYPEMIEAISVEEERERLAEVRFRPASTPRAQEIRWSVWELMTKRGEQSLARGEYEQARQLFDSLTKQFGPNDRALYGLAIVATQQKQPELAKEYFRQAASLTQDPQIRAWSHIYQGRLLDVEGNREGALREYEAALAVGDSSAETRAAAEKGLRESFSAPAESPDSVEATEEQKPRQRVPLNRRGG